MGCGVYLNTIQFHKNKKNAKKRIKTSNNIRGNFHCGINANHTSGDFLSRCKYLFNIYRVSSNVENQLAVIL